MRKKYVNSILASMSRTKQAMCSGLTHITHSAITPAEWATLTLVHSNEGITTKALAAKMGVTVSAASQILKNLETNKMIARRVDPKDKRSSQINLTPSSRKMFDKMEDQVSSHMAQTFTVLSDSELKTLAELHKKVADSLNN